MMHKLAKIISLVACICILASLSVWPKPAAAGLSEWSPVLNIPTTEKNVLAPGIDIRNLAVGNDGLTVYAATGNTDLVYKSIDGGLTWEAIDTNIGIQVDMVAVAPDDNNLVVIAQQSPPKVYFRSSLTTTWTSLGEVRESPGGLPATEIRDLAISPLRNSVHYVGVAGKDANGANLWYFNLGTISSVWRETSILPGFDHDGAAISFAFSPSFETDTFILAVTANYSDYRVKLQSFDLFSGVWNTAASLVDYPLKIDFDATFHDVVAADIAITPEYLGTIPSTRNVFVSLTLNDGSTVAGGIYRFEDTEQKTLSDKKIRSIDFDGNRLIAGSEDSHTVYYSTNVWAFIPTFQTSDVTKCPGGESKTIVTYFGGKIVAGTSGSESAFAVSEDGAYTFNDISLIDTIIDTADDVTVNNDGSTIYLLSEYSSNTSLWYYDSTMWRRVFSKNITNLRVHIAPSDDKIVYLTKMNGTFFDHNTNSGLAPWHVLLSNRDIQDLTVVSAQVVYTISDNGSVSRTADSGFTWNTASSTELDNGATLVSFGTNTLFAGSQNGFVSYTLNGGVTWTKIAQPIKPGAGNVQIALDSDFSTNNIIYAASDVPGGYIMKWIIGTSEQWTDISEGNISQGVWGLVTGDNVLYALEYDPGSGISKLWRLLSPSLAPENSPGWTHKDTDGGIWLKSTPHAVKTSTNKLWAINKNTTGAKLFSYTDVIIDLEVNLIRPPDGFYVNINSITSTAYDVAFSWERPNIIVTGYQLFIARDINFTSNLTTIAVPSTHDIVAVTVGPQMESPYYFDFIPDTTYYWKVRVSNPSYSPFSETRHFIIERLSGSAYETIDLFRTNKPVEQYPSFSWSPLFDTKEYEFRLSDSWTMKELLVDTHVEGTGYKLEIPLEYGGTYFWQVRATKPHLSAWSGIATFNIVLEPEETTSPFVTSPPKTVALTITAPPATKYSLVEQIINVTQPYWPVALFLVILLLGVVLILIFTGKMPKFLAMQLFTKRPPRLPPTTRVTDVERARPTPTLRLPVETPEQPKEPEKIEPHPSLVEKDKEAAAVIFAAKSFMWMTTQPEAPNGTQTQLEEKERHSLGKKLADKIRDVTKKENLYLKYPQDAAMLLNIWAEYSTRNETGSYLAKTFELNPYHAIKLLKCYLPPAQPGQETSAAEDFTLAQYKAVAGVIDPDIVYATLSKIFKFDISTIEEKVPVAPADRNLAFQFMRLHHEAKSQR